MEQTGEHEQEEANQEVGLPLGIDFGNSKISASVWDSKKKAPSIVLNDEKYQFPATLYFSEKNEGQQNEEVAFEEAGESSKQNSEGLKPEVGVEFTPDKNIEYYIYDIKKLIGQKKQ